MQAEAFSQCALSQGQPNQPGEGKYEQAQCGYQQAGMASELTANHSGMKPITTIITMLAQTTHYIGNNRSLSCGCGAWGRLRRGRGLAT